MKSQFIPVELQHWIGLWLVLNWQKAGSLVNPMIAKDDVKMSLWFETFTGFTENRTIKHDDMIIMCFTHDLRCLTSVWMDQKDADSRKWLASLLCVFECVSALFPCIYLSVCSFYFVCVCVCFCPCQVLCPSVYTSKLFPRLHWLMCLSSADLTHWSSLHPGWGRSRVCLCLSVSFFLISLIPFVLNCDKLNKWDVV